MRDPFWTDPTAYNAARCVIRKATDYMRIITDYVGGMEVGSRLRDLTHPHSATTGRATQRMNFPCLDCPTATDRYRCPRTLAHRNESACLAQLRPQTEASLATA